MKVTCDIIRDILPLYSEDMLSDDSRAMVEEHIEACEECEHYLKEIKSSNKIPMDTNTSTLVKIKSSLQRKKIQTVMLSVMLSLIIGVILIAFLTAPEYIPYSEESVTINEIGNGSLIALFDDTVSGYDINVYPTENSIGYEYHITAWNNLWNRMIKKTQVNNTVLNPNGETVTAVYYYQTDGSEDRLIYGEDMNPNGGVVTLPRLFLTYYVLIALILAVICGFIMILFHHHKKVYNVTMKILFLPLSYLLGTLIIKGISLGSYNALRDLYAILLVTIPIYVAFIITDRLIKKRNINKRA